MRKTFQLTVGKKLFASFFAILCLMVSSAWYSLSGFKSVQDNTEDIMQKKLPQVAIINNINYLTEHILSLNLKNIIEQDQSPVKVKANGEEIVRTFQVINEELSRYGKAIDQEEVKKIYASLQTEWESFKALHQEIDQVSKNASSADSAASTALKLLELVRKSDAIFNNMKQYLEYLARLDTDSADKAYAEAEQISTRQMTVSLLFTGISILLALILAFVLTRNISRPVQIVSASLKHIAEGDLRIGDAKIKNRDELGGLVKLLGKMGDDLRAVITGMRNASVHVASSAEVLTANADQGKASIEQIVSTTQQIAATSEESLESVENARKLINQMTVEMQQVAANSHEVAKLTKHTAQVTTQGSEVVHHVLSQINDINKTVKESAESVKNLEGHSRQIGDIVAIITEMANQTNLLALNAAIEAARAGESGRGFAVVANEVRKLAEQSAMSAQQIAGLLGAIQTEIEQTVVSINTGADKVTEGFTQVEQVGQVFQEIDNAIQDVSSRVHEVTNSVSQVALDSRQIVESLDVLGKIAEEVAAGTQQNSAATQEQLAMQDEIVEKARSLSQLAEELRRMIARFQL
ncbi:methyl-accepting chemotaxis protein [Brevibacillus massiliensis]|uniref:methyl-accepting chemotaxis protein n=1 Tax=Brevibacillus massiliensis TaxID=1118054 RepID=UPI00031AE838|nr:HAMP domain-containing methyl-accepting chemotaxis protein [Brevibacillus massiliensis]